MIELKGRIVLHARTDTDTVHWKVPDLNEPSFFLELVIHLANLKFFFYRMAHWLIKSEPFKYSWDQFEKDKQTTWDGVRNYAARLNLNAMKKGDLAFFYHSNEGTEIVGIAKVVKEAYQDPTTEDERWVAVDFAPSRKLKKPVSLAQVKAEKKLAQMALVRLGRLSVQPVTDEEWELVLKMAGEK